MDDPEKTLKAYEGDVNAKKTIRDAITRAYDNLRPELELVHGYETAGMPTFYESFNSGYGMGTGADQMDPLARLNSAARNVARKSAAARTARGILDTRRAGMEDLIRDTWEQWNTGYGMAKDAYARYMEKKAFEESVRQFEENLKLQRYMASRSGGGGGGTTIVLGGTDAVNPTTGGKTVDRAAMWRDKVERYKAMRSNPPANFNIDFIHSQLLKEAISLGLGIDSETLWQMLGNTPAPVKLRKGGGINLNSLL